MAEEFHAEPAALKGYAGLLERNNGHVGSMRDYLDGPHSEAKGLMGFMFPIQNVCEELASWERTILADITEKLASTAEGLTETAESYRTTDHAAAARMDRTVSDGDGD